MRFTYFIGIDISKATFDLCAAPAAHINEVVHKVFPNTTKGFELMIKFLNKQHSDLKKTLFCMENTGDYSLIVYP